MSRYRKSGIIKRRVRRLKDKLKQLHALLVSSFLLNDDELMLIIMMEIDAIQHQLQGASLYMITRPLVVHGPRGLDSLINRFGPLLFNHIRFTKEEVVFMARKFLPARIELSAKHGNVSSVDAMAVTLYRLANHCTLVQAEAAVGYPDHIQSEMINVTVLIISEVGFHALENPMWLTGGKLLMYNQKILTKGSPLDSIVGFIDGTHRHVARSGRMQQALYNGYLHAHSIAFIAVCFPDGSFMMRGPIAGATNDLAVLNETGMRNFLEGKLFTFSVLGDSIFNNKEPIVSIRDMCDNPEVSKALSHVRIVVEWLFGEIVNTFEYLHYTPNMKVLCNNPGCVYRTAAVFHMCRTIFYGSKIAGYFACPPPTFDEIFFKKPICSA